jgi:hypothetical protein
MPVADYHELCVNRSPYERQSAYEFVHALLGVEPAHVHVGRLLGYPVPQFEGVAIVVRVEAGEVRPAGEREYRTLHALLLGEARGEGGRGGDHVGPVEDPGEVPPGPLRHRPLDPLGQA